MTADLFMPARAGVQRLPAISLWQPWASLLFTDPPAKEHETRHWRYPARLHGQRVAIHAAQRLECRDEDLDRLCLFSFGPAWRSRLPRGAFIGTALLCGCTPTDGTKLFNGAASIRDYISGDWGPGRFGWRLEDRSPFTTPIPARGQQGWWTAELPRGT